MRLTPQIGVGVVSIKSKKIYNVTPPFDASKAYAVTASIGAKFECAFASCLGVYVAPEYDSVIKGRNIIMIWSQHHQRLKALLPGSISE